MVNSDGARKKWEFYDIKRDPGEKQDIAAEHPDVIRTMDAAYEKCEMKSCRCWRTKTR
jgi:hypothetical protein